MSLTLENSASRYFLASALALGCDMVLTLVLYHNTAMWMWLSAAVSFVVVGFAFYFVHEFWSFRRVSSAFSARRLYLNLAFLALAVLARMIVIGGLELWRTPEFFLSVVYFLAGAIVSFTLNYVANRYWVFKLQPDNAPHEAPRKDEAGPS